MEEDDLRTAQFKPTAPSTSVAQHWGLLKSPVGQRAAPPVEVKGAAAAPATKARME
jgi:hypothetical protein